MNGMYGKLEETVTCVKRLTDLRPTIGVILGSGLGQLVERMTDTVAIDYRDLPHFPAPTVAGHAGRLVIGRIEGVPVMAMQGRFHYYEGHDMRTIAFPTAFMQRFGARTLIVSNAAGGINRGFTPGDLMLITDHLNLIGTNPLIGLNDERLGPRFPDMTEAYSPRLIALAEEAAAELGKIAGISDLAALGMEMFKVKSAVEGTPARELVLRDYKDFNMNGTKVGIGQLEVVDLSILDAVKADLAADIVKLKAEKGNHSVFLLLTDIMKEGSEILIASDDASVVEKAFGAKPVDGKAWLPKVMSRKKDVVPKFEKVFA